MPRKEPRDDIDFEDIEDLQVDNTDTGMKEFEDLSGRARPEGKAPKRTPPASPLTQSNQALAPPQEEPQTAHFEEILQELERIVLHLEKGEIPLEEALKAFEQGMLLSRNALKILNDAEEKVEILLKNGKAVPFTPEES